MNQNDNRIFRKGDLDWKTLETIGIHKEELEKAGTWNYSCKGRKRKPSH